MFVVLLVALVGVGATRTALLGMELEEEQAENELQLELNAEDQRALVTDRMEALDKPRFLLVKSNGLLALPPTENSAVPWNFTKPALPAPDEAETPSAPPLPPRPPRLEQPYEAVATTPPVRTASAQSTSGNAETFAGSDALVVVDSPLGGGGDMSDFVDSVRAAILCSRQREDDATRPVARALPEDDATSSSALVPTQEEADEDASPVGAFFEALLRRRESPPPPGTCSICYERESNAALLGCGHGELCYECAIDTYVNNHAKCPFCREPVKQVLVVGVPETDDSGQRVVPVLGPEKSLLSALLF